MLVIITCMNTLTKQIGSNVTSYGPSDLKWIQGYVNFFFLRPPGIAAIQVSMGVWDSNIHVTREILVANMYFGKFNQRDIKLWQGIHLEEDSNVDQESDQHHLLFCITSIVFLNEKMSHPCNDKQQTVKLSY